VLLDQFTVTKPDLSASVTVRLTAAPGSASLYSVTVTNRSNIALNGAQIRLTVEGTDTVNTLGRIPPGETRNVQLETRASSRPAIKASAVLVSATALPITANNPYTKK
jgi:P pilus assembly chaperone PapD